MRELLLLRHAKSSWDDPELDDHDRPLAPRGRRACEVMAEHFRERGLAPELVLCSSAQRTRQTLEGVSPGFATEPEVRIEQDLYGASVRRLLARLREVEDDPGSIMLIGHNPSIQELALELAGEDSDVGRVGRKFPTAALATLGFEGDWEGLRPGGAELVGFVRPKQLSKHAA